MALVVDCCAAQVVKLAFHFGDFSFPVSTGDNKILILHSKLVQA